TNGDADVDEWGWDRLESERSFALIGPRVVDANRRLRRTQPKLQRELYTVEGQELTVSQIEALEVLASRPTWRMNEIAAALAIDPSTASRTLAPLVELHLAAREVDPNDRRHVLIQATDKGL